MNLLISKLRAEKQAEPHARSSKTLAKPESLAEGFLHYHKPTPTL